jgi:catechol 2,3-dioxygenase-like lactoylglutathione lyase family enzyme
MTVRWTHITIRVSDLDRSIAFFAHYGGLQLVRDRRLEGGSTVWLGPAAAETPLFVVVLLPGEVVAPLDHFGFQCDSRAEVDRLAGMAEQEGLLVSAPRDSGGSIGYWAMIRDHDGHRYEFTQGQALAGLPGSAA